ncbi:activating transcription factor 7-interacting protein 1 isoform X2 [Lutzomyia longipalpis]|uniref:activating transcription factor 7-interacting protein 1 isoform X2 n=1 Tax=Lutzomyia longipalpis TaxID=7200 RepID=UPI0024834035|nr:activating transcription factor 7-interacting protein 1 isoform X2 [Lutzomyia longipalpis]
MMSTLEAAQEIRSLPSDDIVDASFSIGNHKDLKEGATESTSKVNTEEPTEQDNQDSPPEDSKSENSKVNLEGTVFDGPQGISESDNVGTITDPSSVDVPEKCSNAPEDDVEPLSNGSAVESENLDAKNVDECENVNSKPTDVSQSNEKPLGEHFINTEENVDAANKANDREISAENDAEMEQEESNGIPCEPPMTCEDISADKQDTSDSIAYTEEKTPESSNEECKVMEADSGDGADVNEAISKEKFSVPPDDAAVDVPDTSNDHNEEVLDGAGALETPEESQNTTVDKPYEVSNVSPMEIPTTTEDTSQNDKLSVADEIVDEISEDAPEAAPMEIPMTHEDLSEDTPMETSKISPTDIPGGSITMEEENDCEIDDKNKEENVREDIEINEKDTAKPLEEQEEDFTKDEALKLNEVGLRNDADVVIDLDDMLKEIGVDENIDEANEEEKELPEVSSSTEEKEKEEKHQEIDEDDDVIMMDLDEAPSKVEEKKPTEEEKPKDAKEDTEEDIFKECDELLNSIADEKDLQNDADQAISLDEESSDMPKSSEKAAAEEKVETSEAQAVESLEKEQESTENPPKEETKTLDNADASRTCEDETADKSHDVANSSDDVLIIDDEAEAPDAQEKAPEAESSTKDAEKESPETSEQCVTSEEKPEEMKPTEMDIDEEIDSAAPQKNEPPKSSTTVEEPIPIDDDDLSIDKDEMDELRGDTAKKRASTSTDYEEKCKRMKLSDESEKDTDSQSSIRSSKRGGVDLQDSTSRQSERDDSDTDTMSLKSRKQKLEGKEKVTEAEKDVGSLLTPLPKKISMEFMTRFKKPFQDMSHADLEDFVLQKIAELITHKSEYSEMRKKLEKQEEMIGFYRTKLAELSKNFHDLEVVYKRVQQDLDNRNSGYVQIPKITRAVGLQVSVSNSRKQHSSSAVANDIQANAARSQAAAQEAAKRAKPNQRFTPMRPPMSEAEQRNLDVQEQKKRQEMMQQTQQKLALNAASSPNTSPSIAQRTSSIVVLKHTPKPTNKVVTPPQQPYVVKRTAVRTSTVTSTVVTKTVTPASQTHQQRVIISPSTVAPSQQQSPQQPLHKVTLQPQRAMSVLSPPKKQQVVVDLTDEDDNAKATKLGPQQPKTSVPQTLLNGNIPALVAIPSSSSSKSTAKYVMVQPVAATNGQLPPKTMPNKYVPIAPKPADVTIRPAVPPQNILRRPPMTSTMGSTPQIQARPAARLMAPQRTHPAPLPPFQNQPSQYGMKRIPTRPVIRIKNDEKQGIVISWTMDDLTDDHEEIRDYQIYAYQETSAAPSTDNWRLVGDVKSMMLPMAVTLSQFQEGQRYWFAVRARDIHDRCGMFSVPRTW